MPRRSTPTPDQKFEEWRSAVHLESAKIDSHLKVWHAINDEFGTRGDELQPWAMFLDSTRWLYVHNVLTRVWAIAWDSDGRTASISQVLGFARRNETLFDKSKVVERARTIRGYDEPELDLLAARTAEEHPMTSEVIDRLIARFEKLDPARRNISGWRHNVLAHMNRNYASPNVDVSEDYPMSIEQIEHVFEACGEIWLELSLAYDSTHITWGAFSSMPMQIHDLIKRAVG